MQLRNWPDYLSYKTAQFKNETPCKIQVWKLGLFVCFQLDTSSQQKSWTDRTLMSPAGAAYPLVLTQWESK